MKRLVFIHGRAQEFKDATALKNEWIASWKLGLDAAHLPYPIQDGDVAFPYYGQTLFDLVEGKTPEEAAKVIVRGTAPSDEGRAFIEAILREQMAKFNISDRQILTLQGLDVNQRGPQHWEWVQGILRALDKHVPGASGASIALITNDVYQYLTSGGIRDIIETGVRNAMTSDQPTVVVSHSLGTVVAYQLLRREGAAARWSVPTFITLGSPLGVNRIKKELRPISRPQCIGDWFNAIDERDVVALYPLDDANFPVDPSIRNKTDVMNDTENHHGISGYLSDPEVAKTIYDALVAP